MTRLQVIALFFLLPFMSHAQEVIYNKSDSIAIERILHEEQADAYNGTGDLALAIADRFIGCEYVAGTLENGNEEPLFVSTEKLDCSTFVELVTAIVITIESGDKDFCSFCRNLEKIRYRDGIRNGYESRLHYTTWWIEDNISKGTITEFTENCSHKFRTLNLCFMSKHPDSYPMLKNDIRMQKRIEELEKPFRGISSSYIPKESLNDKENIKHIKNGDIIALVTTVAGLDIAHVGFAYWEEGNLHLLHASSAKSKVIKDPLTLYEYQKNKKKQIGIKVLRISH